MHDLLMLLASSPHNERTVTTVSSPTPIVPPVQAAAPIVQHPTVAMPPAPNPTAPPTPPKAHHLLFAKLGLAEGDGYKLTSETITPDGRNVTFVRTFERLSDSTYWSVTSQGSIAILTDTLTDITNDLLVSAVPAPAPAPKAAS